MLTCSTVNCLYSSKLTITLLLYLQIIFFHWYLFVKVADLKIFWVRHDFPWAEETQYDEIWKGGRGGGGGHHGMILLMKRTRREESLPVHLG
jgi:hypothetical protein